MSRCGCNLHDMEWNKKKVEEIHVIYAVILVVLRFTVCQHMCYVKIMNCMLMLLLLA